MRPVFVSHSIIHYSRYGFGLWVILRFRHLHVILSSTYVTDPGKFCNVVGDLRSFQSAERITHASRRHFCESHSFNHAPGDINHHNALRKGQGGFRESNFGVRRSIRALLSRLLLRVVCADECRTLLHCLHRHAGEMHNNFIPPFICKRKLVPALAYQLAQREAKCL